MARSYRISKPRKPKLQHMGQGLRRQVKSGAISAKKARTVHQTRVAKQQREVHRAVRTGSTAGLNKRQRKAVARKTSPVKGYKAPPKPRTPGNPGNATGSVNARITGPKPSVPAPPRTVPRPKPAPRPPRTKGPAPAPPASGNIGNQIKPPMTKPQRNKVVKAIRAGQGSKKLGAYLKNHPQPKAAPRPGRR